MERIVISGTYCTGKTTLSLALSQATGIPSTHALTMREILPRLFPGRTLRQCSYAELLCLGMERFGERIRTEALLREGFISDGCTLQEWLYGSTRLLTGAYPDEYLWQMRFKRMWSYPAYRDFKKQLDGFGGMAKAYARTHYDVFFHLPVEFAFVADGHRPTSERFRQASERLLLRTYGEIGLRPVEAWSNVWRPSSTICSSSPCCRSTELLHGRSNCAGAGLTALHWKGAPDPALRCTGRYTCVCPPRAGDTVRGGLLESKTLPVMRFELQFDIPTEVTAGKLDGEDALVTHFPFTTVYRYHNEEVAIERYHYHRSSLQMDRYLVHGRSGYSVGIVSDTDAYVLIVVGRGGLHYGPADGGSTGFQLESGQCRMIYAPAGQYRVRFRVATHSFHVICFAPELLHLLNEEFDEMTAFMEGAERRHLSAMAARKMDRTFLRCFHRLVYTPFASHKEYIRHFLREIPALISAYKGLLKGRDRESGEKVVIDQIIRYITEKIRNREHVSVVEICTAFPVSRRKLERMFRTSMHCLPTAYIRRIKMEEVAKVLIATNAPLDHIAWDFGYSDRRSLSLAFKKVLGELPSVYRLKNQKRT